MDGLRNGKRVETMFLPEPTLSKSYMAGLID